MSQDSLGGKESLKIIQPSTALLSRLSWVMATWVQSISTDGDNTFLANLSQHFSTLTGKMGLLVLGWNFMFCLCMLPLVLSLFSVPDHR